MRYFAVLLFSVVEPLQPFYIQADPPASSFETSLDVIEALSLPVRSTQIENLKGMRDYRRALHSELDGSAGKAWFYDENRVLFDVRFWQVRSRTDFAEFVEKQRMGGNLTWSKNRSLVVLKDRMFGAIALPDMWGAYDDRTVVWSKSASTHKLHLKTLVRRATEFNSKNFAFVFDPSALPEKYRSAMLAAMERQLSISLQRRDNESFDKHLLRRMLVLSSLHILEMASDGLGSVRAWTKWPKFDLTKDSFECGFKIETKPGSDLQKFFKEMTLSETDTLVPSELGNAGRLDLHLRIPSAICKILRHRNQSVKTEGVHTQYKKDQDNSSSLWLYCLSNLATSGQIEGAAIASNHPQPVLRGVFGVDIQVPKFSVSLIPKRDTLIDKNAFKSFQFSGEGSDGLFVFACAPKPDLADWKECIQKKPSRTTPMIRFQSDLSKWTADFDPESPAAELLEAIELTFEEWMNRRVQSNLKELFRQSVNRAINNHGLDEANAKDMLTAMTGSRSTALKGEFTNLLKEPDPESDWTINGQVRFINNALTGTLRIGRDFHRHLRARELVGSSRQPR